MESIKLHKKDFEPIKSILDKGDNTNMMLVQSGDKRVTMINDEVTTEIFITSYSPDVLVIQRVCIKNQRQGTMSKVLDQLKYIAKSSGFSKIMIQSVMSEAMAKFCLKHGFVAQTFHNHGIIDFSPYELFCDYILEVS